MHYRVGTGCRCFFPSPSKLRRKNCSLIFTKGEKKNAKAIRLQKDAICDSIMKVKTEIKHPNICIHAIFDTPLPAPKNSPSLFSIRQHVHTHLLIWPPSRWFFRYLFFYAHMANTRSLRRLRFIHIELPPQIFFYSCEITANIGDTKRIGDAPN